MPHGSRAVIMFAVGMSAVTASLPALGQTGDTTSGLARPDRIPPPRFPEPRRDPPASPSPWSAAPAFGAGSSPGGITQKQAMDILAATGFTSIDVPRPNADGSWTSFVYSNREGRRIRATVDLRGNVTGR